MICSNCKAENADSAKYCHACGKYLQKESLSGIINNFSSHFIPNIDADSITYPDYDNRPIDYASPKIAYEKVRYLAKKAKEAAKLGITFNSNAFDEADFKRYLAERDTQKLAVQKTANLESLSEDFVDPEIEALKRSYIKSLGNAVNTLDEIANKLKTLQGPLSFDEITKSLNLTKELQDELIIILKITTDKGWAIYDWADLKAMCQEIIKYSSHYNEYCPNARYLKDILRAIVLAEAKGIDPRNSNLDKEISTIDSVFTGEDFEKYCGSLLIKNGYTNIEYTSTSGDHGVDILATKDFISYAIQCKYYSSPVGNSAIQEVYSGKSIYNRDIAVVMTNSTFTAQAINDAQSLGVKLWDCDIIKQLQG